jgi:hypothetical protein
VPFISSLSLSKVFLPVTACTQLSTISQVAATVKFGYVPVTVALVQLAIATVWSGAELVILSLFSSAQDHSATVIPVQDTTLSATYHAVGSQASYFTLSSAATAVIVTLVASLGWSSVTSTEAHIKFRLALAVNGVPSSWIICHAQVITISPDPNKLLELIVFMLLPDTSVACLASTAVFTAFCDG